MQRNEKIRMVKQKYLPVSLTEQELSERSNTTQTVSPFIQRTITFRYKSILVDLARACSARTFLDFFLRSLAVHASICAGMFVHF